MKWNLCVLLTATLFGSLSAQEAGGGGGSQQYGPQAHIEVRNADGAAGTPDVAPLKWHSDALCLGSLLGGLLPAEGDVTAKVTCEFKQDNLPAGWSLVKVQWSPSKDQFLEMWENDPLDPNLLPMLMVGSILHDGDGVGATSSGHVYFAHENVARCNVTYRNPEGTLVNFEMSASTSEYLLSVGGPLNCGVVDQSFQPSWDSGSRPEDGVFQDAPWYLDFYGDTEPFANKESGYWGQVPQKGQIWCEFLQPDEVTAIEWTFEGNPYHKKGSQAPTAASVYIAARNNTANGTIKAHTKYRGTYHGVSFEYEDESESCPPPNEFALRPDYYKYTGHMPKPITEHVAAPVSYDATTPYNQIGTTGSYVSMFVYYLKVLDESSRPMRGCMVQERWDVLSNGPTVIIDMSKFKVNNAGQYWTTSRKDLEGYHTNLIGEPFGDAIWFEAGIFGPDFVGCLAVSAALKDSNADLYTGRHHYWAGTGWCPKLVPKMIGPVYQNYYYPVNDPSPPGVNQGQGIFLGAYDIVIRTNGAQQSKSSNQDGSSYGIGGGTGGGTGGGSGGSGGSGGGS